MRSKTAGLLIAVFCMAAAFAGCSKPDVIKAGSKVAAIFGSSWYLASVSEVKGDEYNVKYDDGTNGTVKANEIKAIPAVQKFKVGEKVFASWNDGAKLYAGVVQEVKETGCVVKWDDGSAPSEVASSKIVRQ